MATQIRTKAEFIALREALHHYFGPELGLPDASYYDDVWTDSHAIFKWKGRQNFLEELTSITKYKLNINKPDPSLLKAADKELLILEAEAPAAVEFKEAKGPEAEANRPTVEALERMEKEGKITKAEKERLKGLSDLHIQQAIDQKSQIIERQNVAKAQALKAEALKKDLEGKKIYVKVTQTTPQVSQKSPEVLAMQEQAISFPRQFVETTAREYSKKLDNQNLSVVEKDRIAMRAALSTQYALSGKSPIVEAAKIQAITNPEVLAQILESLPDEKPEEQNLQPETTSDVRVSPKPEGNLEKAPEPIPSPVSATPTTQPGFSTEEAARPEEIVSQGFTPLRIPEAPAEAPATVSGPKYKDAFTKHVESHDILRQTVRNRFSMQMSQLELYKQFVDTTKIDGVSELNQLKVEVSFTPQEGFEELDLNRDILNPQIDTYSQQNELLDTLSLPVDVGSAKVKAEALERIGQSLTAEIAKLPPDSAIAQVFNSEAVQAGLAYTGLTVPSSWVAVEGSWVGNLIVSSGYGPVAGFIQASTGLNLGIIEVLPTVEIGGIAGSASLVGTETALIVGGDLAGSAAAGAVGGATSATVAGAATSASVSVAAGTAAATATAGTAAGTAAAGTTIVTAGVAAAPVTGGISAVLAAVAAAVTAVVGPKVIHAIQDFVSKNGKMIMAGTGLLLGSFMGVALGAGAALGGGLGFTLGYSSAAIAQGGMAGLQTAATTVISTIGTATAIITQTLLAAIGPPIIAALIGFPIFIILVLHIINSGAYLVPQQVADSPFSGIGIGGLGPDGRCPTDKGPVGVPGPSSSSQISNRAYGIVFDLYQGFWCFWNRPPSNNPASGPPRADFPNDTVQYPPNYPTLFDYSAYFANPMPPSNFQGNLFWCTWLVVKAYNETGNSTPPSLYTPNMYNDFLARNKILDATQANSSNVVPGSVVFFHVTTGQNRLNHVGIVYTVDRGGFTFVQSNAPLKSQSANFTAGGVGTVGGTMQVKYFGLP
jgi:hypothetical protein